MPRNPKMTEERRQKIIAYLLLPESQRIPLPDFRKQTGIHRNTFAYVKAEFEAEQREKAGKQERWNQAREIMAQHREGTEVRVHRDEPIIVVTDKPEALKKDTINKLYERVMDTGDPNAAFRLAQIMGWIVEKKEEKIHLTINADDIARRNFEAERRLRESGAGGNRVVNVSKKRPLLSDPTRPDNQF